jgi:hypothetical protein
MLIPGTLAYCGSTRAVPAAPTSPAARSSRTCPGTATTSAWQWCVYPTNLDDESTNWGQGLPEETWWHIAVVNDGQTTKLYVEGCETVDNPPTVAVGLVQLALPWALGGYEYGGTINQIFQGWPGDIRVVNRALSTGEFMIAGS